MNFFRKGNLIALRELALRRTADRVDAQAREYRDDEAIKRVWQLKERLLVAIGPGAHSEQIVRAGRRLAGSLRAEWIAVYVETPTLQRLPEAERARILRALRLAQELGAETATVPGQDVATALIAFAGERNASKIVLGRSSAPAWRRWIGQSKYDALLDRAGAVDLLVVGGETTEQPAPVVSLDQPDRRDYASKWRAYAEAMGVVAVVSVIALFLRDRIEVTNIAMLYLVAVVWVSVRTGRGPAVAASVVGVGLFDFICVPPYFTFAVSDTEYLLTFAVMLGVALTITELTAGMRYQARIAAHRERRAAALAAMSRELSGAVTAEQIAEIAVQHVRGVFEAPSILLLPDRGEGLHIAPAGQPNALPNVDLSVAQWVHDRWQPAGLGTDTLAGTPIHYVPLRAPVRSRGVLALAPRNERLIFVPEQRRLLDTFAAQIALALERVHFVEVAQEAEIGMSSERLRNSLLASISHDLRTPLSVIAGAAGSLVEQELTPEARRELTATIYDQAIAMSELTANVLDMARLETGAVQLNRQWHPFEEVVGVVLERLCGRLEERRVDVDLTKSPPLVWLDAVLMGQVLTNLLDNAVKYTPARSPIELSAAAVVDGFEVAVADRGAGLVPGEEQRVFDKFYRAHPEGSTGGAGLGLAICRAIVEAHRGHIRAENRTDGGVRFSFVLPQPTPPAGPTPETESTSDSQP